MDQSDVTAEAERREIAKLVEGSSIETVSRGAAVDEACHAQLPPGTQVFITFLPSDTLAARVNAAVQLRRAGLEPVPHLAARRFADVAQLDGFLARIVGEAGVERFLVIAGDVDRPVGAFASSLDLIETGLFERHGIRHLGIAGYAERHPRIPDAVLDEALRAKLARVRERGIAPFIVTQFCFEAGPIAAWLARHRDTIGDTPVRIGLAGPANPATLMRYAARCGVGNSIRAAWRDSYWARILIRTGPEQVIRDIARNGDIMPQIGGLHFFTFGGIQKACAWISAVKRGAFELAGEKEGFRVRV